MKSSSRIEQQLAELRKQLTMAKRHERRSAERQFITLAKQIGIFGLPAEQLTREFQAAAKSATSPSPIALHYSEEAGNE